MGSTVKAISARDLEDIAVDLRYPTCLFADQGHAIYWLGITEETAFRCNAYLIRDGAEALLVDPGSRNFFPYLSARVSQIMAPSEITGIVLCHQDPDVAGSMVEWLTLNPACRIFSSPRTHVLLPHYGGGRYQAYDVVEQPRYLLPGGGHLQFIEAPFLHSPGAFATYDAQARYLFSGDIWAALDLDWSLTTRSFQEHVSKMDLFHMDYMASNQAARGFVQRLAGLRIEAILPQHGSLLGPRHVEPALDYLRNLQCGVDIIYAALEP
jgi:flavorubredoxin